MELGSWAAFAAAAFIVAIVPGPGVASIIGFAFGSGRRVALAAVGGMAAGNAVAMSLSLAGTGALLAASAWAFALLKWTGAAWLIVIGVIAIRRSATPGALVTARPAVGAHTAFLSIVAVGTVHPKTILFFVAFAAQFIHADRPYAPQAAILILTFTTIAATTDMAYALAASRAAGLVRDDRFRRWAGRAGGAILIGAGIATATMRR